MGTACMSSKKSTAHLSLDFAYPPDDISEYNA